MKPRDEKLERICAMLETARGKLSVEIVLPAPGVIRAVIDGMLSTRKPYNVRKSSPKDPNASWVWTELEFHRSAGSLYRLMGNRLRINELSPPDGIDHKAFADQLESLASVLAVLTGSTTACDNWARALGR